MSVGVQLLFLVTLACPTQEPVTSSATRTLDLGETGLHRTHLAVALLAGASPSLAHRLSEAGFDASPRGAWRLYYRALTAAEAPGVVASLRASGSDSAPLAEFEDHLDAVLHTDEIAPAFPIAPPEPTSVPIVLARLGARPPGFFRAQSDWLGPEPAFRPRISPTPKRISRTRVSLFDRRDASVTQVGIVFTSTTDLGRRVVEAVAHAVGDGPLSRLGRALRPHIAETSLASLSIEDATASAFSLRLRVETHELSDLARVIAEILRQLESGGLPENERSSAIRRARGWRGLMSATPRGRLETRLLDHLRSGLVRSPGDFDCLTKAQVQAAARALAKPNGLRLLVEGDVPPALAAELARQWPKAEIELRRAR